MRSDSIKLLGVLAVCSWIGLAVAPAAQIASEPFFPVGVMYRLDPGATTEQVRDDLQRIRAQGFNVIQLQVAWPPPEPPGVPSSPNQLSSLLDLAARADLQVITPQAPRDRLFANRLPVHAGSTLSGPTLRLWAWASMALGARALIFSEPSETAAAFARVVTRNSALFDALRPRLSTNDVRIDGGNGAVEARFLESPVVLMLIAFNKGEQDQRVTMTFSPDTQEAIWQNMETGTSVNFVAGPNGPVYTYRFAPFDTLVLMIRKTIR